MFFLLKIVGLAVLVVLGLKLLKTMRSDSKRADAGITVKAWAVSGIIWAVFPLVNIVVAAMAAHPAAAVATVAPVSAIAKPAVVAPAKVVTAPATAAPTAPAAVPAAPVPAAASPSASVAPEAPVAPTKVAHLTPAVRQVAHAKKHPSGEDSDRKKSEAKLDALNAKLGSLLK